MSRSIRRYACAFAVLLSLYYAGWQSWLSWLDDGGYPVNNVANQSLISRIDRINTNNGHGNLLAVQPWMTPNDYRDGLRFREKLRAYLQTAKDSGLIVPQKTIVVFPEYLGTWLVALNAPNRVYASPTVQAALTAMVVSSPAVFWNACRSAPDGVTDKTNTPYSP